MIAVAQLLDIDGAPVPRMVAPVEILLNDEFEMINTTPVKFPTYRGAPVEVYGLRLVSATGRCIVCPLPGAVDLLPATQVAFGDADIKVAPSGPEIGE